jgi:hypothetical protein
MFVYVGIACERSDYGRVCVAENSISTQMWEKVLGKR